MGSSVEGTARGVGVRWGGLAPRPPEVSPAVLHAGLECMRAGDVGDGSDRGAANRLPIVQAAIVGAERSLQNRVASRDDGHRSGKRFERVALVVDGEAGLD